MVVNMGMVVGKSVLGVLCAVLSIELRIELLSNRQGWGNGYVWIVVLILVVVCCWRYCFGCLS